MLDDRYYRRSQTGGGRGVRHTYEHITQNTHTHTLFTHTHTLKHADIYARVHTHTYKTLSHTGV